MTTVITLLSDAVTPVALFDALCGKSDMGFLLESAEGDVRLARYSVIGLDPRFTVSFFDGIAEIKRSGESGATALETKNPLLTLKSVLESERREYPHYRELERRVGKLPFVGGLVGYLGYGATAAFEKIPQQTHDPFQVPDGCYGFYDIFIIFDHLQRAIHVISHRSPHTARAVVDRIRNRTPLTPLFDARCSDDEIFNGVSDSVERPNFCALVERCKEYVREGQVFQIVPSHRFSLPVSSPPLNIYRNLVGLNPSPYAYFLKFPNFAYLGSSPETFVSCQDGRVTLRALAGTRPRGATPEDDARLERELRNDEKELAEHRMLVDLGRNDLGRVCKVGTVTVGEIATVVRYAHVMHLATEISGELRDDKTSFDVMQSCFPRGTVTGAPKIRAMQLLAELEPERRGIYSGAVGYIDLTGNCDGAIAIRSTLVKSGVAHVNAGAGVVYDSDPEREYEETRNKAKSVLKAIQIAERQASHDPAH
jgi:anthranilate synthase component 1